MFPEDEFLASLSKHRRVWPTARDYRRQERCCSRCAAPGVVPGRKMSPNGSQEPGPGWRASVQPHRMMRPTVAGCGPGGYWGDHQSTSVRWALRPLARGLPRGDGSVEHELPGRCVASRLARYRDLPDGRVINHAYPDAHHAAQPQGMRSRPWRPVCQHRLDRRRGQDPGSSRLPTTAPTRSAAHAMLRRARLRIAVSQQSSSTWMSPATTRTLADDALTRGPGMFRTADTTSSACAVAPGRAGPGILARRLTASQGGAHGQDPTEPPRKPDHRTAGVVARRPRQRAPRLSGNRLQAPYILRHKE
jgi:hypothetical protein